MSRQVYVSDDLRDAVLGELFAGCYENKLDISSFVHDLDAFAEQRSFKKICDRTFLFYIDENFEKDLANFMMEHIRGKIYDEFWGRHIVQKMKVLHASNRSGCLGCKREHEDPVENETCRKCLVLASVMMDNEYETADKKVVDQGEKTVDTLARVREIYPEMELLYTDWNYTDWNGGPAGSEPSVGKVENYIFKHDDVIYITPRLCHRPDGKWMVRPESLDNKNENWTSFKVETLDEALDILRKGKKGEVSA